MAATEMCSSRCGELPVSERRKVCTRAASPYYAARMNKDAATVDDYMEGLPPERRAMVQTLRSAVKSRLPSGFEETMQYGMISYIVPSERYPETYNKQPLAIISIGNQKNYVSLYLMSHYGDAEAENWLQESFRNAEKRLDMGKSCLRFRKPDDIPVEVISQAAQRLTVDEFIHRYEASRR